jgi:OTU-like cysteine protease
MIPKFNYSISLSYFNLLKESLSLKSDYFKNFQGWQIQIQIHDIEGFPAFYLKDSYGFSHIVTEFVVENIEISFRHALTQTSSVEEQQILIRQYLQNRLNEATPYQLHIEHYHHQLFLRFGDYGLKGGGKKTAKALSLGQLGAGIFLSATGGGFILLAGGILVSAGLSGGIYTLQQTEENYKNKEYAKQTSYGALTGLVSGGFGALAQGAGTALRIGSQILGSAVGTVTSTTTAEIVEKGQLPSKQDLLKKVLVAGIGGGAGACVAAGVGYTLGKVAAEISDDLSRSAFQIFKKSIEGATNSASTKITTNVCEGEEPLKDITQSLLVGGLINGSVASAKQIYNSNELSRLINIKKGLDNYYKNSPETGQDFERVQDILQRQIAIINEFDQQYIKNLKVYPNQSFQEVLSNKHEIPLQADPVSYIDTDCSMQELASHVVLVHSVTGDNVDRFPGVDMERAFSDSSYRAACVLKSTITPHGIIGHHLELKKKEFQGELVTRPHLHWSWNQLVQPNSGGNWEDASIAILEPFSTFESSTGCKPFGIAPYDTFNFNPHKLSSQSTILVPTSILEEVRAYLTHFRGRILPFSDTSRSAIMDALEMHYPETWHMCDETGKLIGREVRKTNDGFNSATCIKKSTGEIIILLENEGLNEGITVTELTKKSTIKSQAMKEFDQSKRFIGLHAHAATVLIEDHFYFKQLKAFTTNYLLVKNNKLFAGSIQEDDNLDTLGVLEALVVYQRLMKFDPRTGTRDVANYIINEALYADLVSLFYQLFPADPFNLSVLDVKMIFATSDIYLITLLDDLRVNVKIKDPTIENHVRARNFFTLYCSTLEEHLIKAQKAKQEAIRFMDLAKESDPRFDAINQPLCLLVAQEEWEKISVPTEGIDFDLGKNWPHSDQMHEYANKVLRTLPTDLEKLRCLYQQLYSLCRPAFTLEETKDQYRLNIILSIMQWACQEKIYLDTNREIKSSILANKLSNQIGWLADYGLEAEDFTSKIGDCLFDNFVAQLPSGMKTSDQLRQEVVQFLRDHQESYADKINYRERLMLGEGLDIHIKRWEEYLNGMSFPQVWATEIEIQALSEMMACPVVILTQNIKAKIYHAEGKNTPVFLHHVHSNHFEACLPFKGLNPQDVYQALKNKNYY